MQFQKCLQAGTWQESMLVALGRQMIANDMQVRLHEAALIKNLEISSEMEEVTASKRAGLSYAEQTKTMGKLHELGSPHVRIWAAFATTLNLRKDLPEKLKSKLQSYIAEAQTPQQVALNMKVFRLTQMRNETKHRLQVCVSPALQPLWQLIEDYLIEKQGAKILSGIAPRGPYVRRVEQLLANQNTER
eukprot:TRINITY_DN94712_c0_g1_i1.p2 TRINITY_DN94712_c0_g1~~TRINITY_DN94712_c0_g1_i1.p2  ORF type:complete len:189 (+),score=31.48 TRINITY_DN94712_c0_g1_i1:123-689(+)